VILATECYIQRENQILMLYRNKKQNDINKGKYIGLGGKFEYGESPEQCLLREIKEEAGVTLTDYRLRGIVTFIMLDGSSEPIYMFVYTAGGFTGEISACDEGELHWVDKDKILSLDLWEGDKLFWRWLLEDKRFFSAKFIYNENTLVEHQETFYI